MIWICSDAGPRRVSTIDVGGGAAHITAFRGFDAHGPLHNSAVCGSVAVGHFLAFSACVAGLGVDTCFIEHDRMAFFGGFGGGYGGGFGGGGGGRGPPVYMHLTPGGMPVEAIRGPGGIDMGQILQSLFASMAIIEPHEGDEDLESQLNRLFAAAAGPPEVGTSTAVLEGLPVAEVTTADVAARLQCSVCMDDFVEGETVSAGSCAK